MKVNDFTTVPLGTILPFALDVTCIPDGWLLCDGKEIPIKYKTLRESFKIYNTPNLIGRTLIGSGMIKDSISAQSDGKSPNFGGPASLTLGYTGGEYQHQLTINEMPRHRHTIYGGNFGLHHRSFSGSGDSDIPFKTESDLNRRLYGTDYEGGDAHHNTMQPYYVINYIIYAGSE